MTLALLSMVYLQALHYKAATVLHTGSNGTIWPATEGCQQADG
jgi:hypothetical protein